MTSGIGALPQAGRAASIESDRASLTEHALDVPAYTLTTRIDRAALGRALTDAITGEIRAALWDAGVPSWAVERVERFAKPLYPLKRVSSGGQNRDEKGHKTGGSADLGVGKVAGVGGKIRGKGDSEWAVSTGTAEQPADELAGKFQEFYVELEDAIWERLAKSEQKQHGSSRHGIHFGGKRDKELESYASSVSESVSEMDEGSNEKNTDEEEGDGERRKEERIRGLMDAVERVLCSLFYDRLFLLSNTDDAEHDEALSSRIAAVNLLDLGLAHLGVDVGESGKEVEAVVRECGQCEPALLGQPICVNG